MSKGEVRQQIGFLIKRVQQALRARMDAALADHGLTTSQFAVLAHLRETAGISNAELARRSFVAAPTMIRIVQDLEKLEYISRMNSESNKRVVNVTLTQKGRRTISACDSKVTAIQKQMLAGMSAEDIARFSRLLIQSAERLEADVLK